MPVVLITGASRGIGRATAFAFARDCWCVAVNYCHSRKQGLEVVEAIRDFGGLACPSPATCAIPRHARPWSVKRWIPSAPWTPW